MAVARVAQASQVRFYDGANTNFDLLSLSGIQRDAQAALDYVLNHETLSNTNLVCAFLCKRDNVS